MMNIAWILLLCSPLVLSFRPFFPLRAVKFHDPQCFFSSAETEGYAPLKQLSILLNCDEVDPDEISELLFEVGCLSVSVEVLSEKPEVLNDESKWADLVKTRSWANALLRANIPASFDEEALVDIIRTSYPSIPFEVHSQALQPRDWVAEVQQEWKPQLVGDLTIRFPWHADQPVETKHCLTLEGGAAFGTGDHPTTRLCLRFLQRTLAQRQPAMETSVLDYGCGSAILALAALKYGATSAVGTEIDRDALLSSRRNALNNNLHVDLFLADEDPANEEIDSVLLNQLRGMAPDLKQYIEKEEDVHFPGVEALKDQSFDLVVANILAPILISLAPSLAAHTKTDGKLAMSGVIAKQTEAVCAAYRPFFSRVEVEEAEEDWVLITASGRKRAD